MLNRYQEVVDESIKLVMKKRQLTSQARGLTEQDLFFREVCLGILQAFVFIVLSETCLQQTNLHLAKFYHRGTAFHIDEDGISIIDSLRCSKANDAINEIKMTAAQIHVEFLV